MIGLPPQTRVNGVDRHNNNDVLMGGCIPMVWKKGRVVLREEARKSLLTSGHYKCSVHVVYDGVKERE